MVINYPLESNKIYFIPISIIVLKYKIETTNVFKYKNVNSLYQIKTHKKYIFYYSFGKEKYLEFVKNGTCIAILYFLILHNYEVIECSLVPQKIQKYATPDIWNLLN